jgi:MHS family proline/betaine transporter-like MFS transporter
MQIKKRTVLATLLGTSLEYYDFFIYGILAPTMAPLFFPENLTDKPLIWFFGVFALAYLVRPIGALTFAYVGDRYGRKKALAFSVLLMAIPTTLIGILPTYESIGIWAPILLITLRLAQSLSAGGEFIGASIYLVEHAKRGIAYFAGSLLYIASVSAPLLDNLVCVAFKNNWRIPFLLGSVVGLVGYYIRQNLAESPIFLEVQSRKNKEQSAFSQVISNYKIECFFTACIIGFAGAVFYTTSIYMSTYLQTELHWESTDARVIAMIGSLVAAILFPFFASLADRKINVTKMMITGCVILILAPIPLFKLLSTGDMTSVIVAEILLAICYCFFVAPTNTYVISLFPSEIRYTGVALGYSIGNMLFAGTLHLIHTFLIEKTGDKLMPAYYLVFLALLAIIPIYMSRKRANLSNIYGKAA